MQYKVKAIPLEWVDTDGYLHGCSYAVFKRKHFWNNWEFYPHSNVKYNGAGKCYYFEDGTFTNYNAALNYAKELNSIN